jgi:hypothetical protein
MAVLDEMTKTSAIFYRYYDAEFHVPVYALNRFIRQEMMPVKK